MGRLIGKASERANHELTRPSGFAPGIFIGLPQCGTFYGAPVPGMSNELIAWFLGIILAEYAAGILGEKVREGHCNAHRVAPTYSACPDMQQEHMKMLEAFRDRVKQLVADVEVAVNHADNICRRQSPCRVKQQDPEIRPRGLKRRGTTSRTRWNGSAASPARRV